MQSSLCCQHVEILVISLAQMTLMVPVILCSSNAHCFAWLADGGPESRADNSEFTSSCFGLLLLSFGELKGAVAACISISWGKMVRKESRELCLTEQPRL